MNPIWIAGGIFSLVGITMFGVIWKMKSVKPMNVTRLPGISANWVTNDSYFAGDDALDHPDLEKMKRAHGSINGKPREPEYKVPPAGGY